MNKERNNKRDWGFFGRGRYRRLRRMKCQSRREKERRAAWKFDEITNGFKVETRYYFPNPFYIFFHIKEININES